MKVITLERLNADLEAAMENLKEAMDDLEKDLPAADLEVAKWQGITKYVMSLVNRAENIGLHEDIMGIPDWARYFGETVAEVTYIVSRAQGNVDRDQCLEWALEWENLNNKGMYTIASPEEWKAEVYEFVSRKLGQ